jgi:hypothetical protein
VGIIIGLIIVYFLYEGILFSQDRSTLGEIQNAVSSGDVNQAIVICDNLHYWKNSTCSSLIVARTVQEHPESILVVCDGISVLYDGPWWTLHHQAYVDSLAKRKQACITQLLSNHGLTTNSP